MERIKTAYAEAAASETLTGFHAITIIHIPTAYICSTRTYGYYKEYSTSIYITIAM